MDFDYIKFHINVEKILLELEKAKDLFSPEVTLAIEPIASMLKIGRINVSRFNTIEQEKENSAMTFILYDSPAGYDSDHLFRLREVTGNDAVIYYDFYEVPNEEEWSEFERERINFLAKMLFAFQGRCSVMDMVFKLSYFDQQLGINNLRFVLKQMGKLISQGKIGQYTVVYFNLRKFFIVNQLVGRDKGTIVMRNFAKQLQQLIGESGFLGRIGGDNFIALFKDSLVNLVLKMFKGVPIRFGEADGDVVEVMASAGVYNIPPDALTPEDIMDRVSIAQNFARNVDKKLVVFFDEKLLEHENNAKMVESYFPTALANEEYHVFYQPKVSLKDYKLAGAEALCRWIHDGRLMPPNTFIPFLEETMSICELDFYMLEHVCQDIQRWLSLGKKVVRISVNFSRKHMVDMRLLDHITEVVDRYQVPHELLEIELTETTTDVGFSDLKRVAFGLKERGFCTAVDDFGVGYSSLNLIKEFPWTVLKIDKTLVPATIDEKSSTYIMFKHIIALAQSMGLECIAEGVETEEQVQLLIDNGCYLAQGYYFDKPMPRADFYARMAADFSYKK